MIYLYMPISTAKYAILKLHIDETLELLCYVTSETLAEKSVELLNSKLNWSNL